MVSKTLMAGFPCITVTSPLALGKSALMPEGESGNWMISVGSTEASTLTVGAICSPLLKLGVRNAGGVVGKEGVPPEEALAEGVPPAVVPAECVWTDPGWSAQAVTSRLSRAMHTSTRLKRRCE